MEKHKEDYCSSEVCAAINTGQGTSEIMDTRELGTEESYGEKRKQKNEVLYSPHCTSKTLIQYSWQQERASD